jgi:hypothetical protein
MSDTIINLSDTSIAPSDTLKIMSDKLSDGQLCPLVTVPSSVVRPAEIPAEDGWELKKTLFTVRFRIRHPSAGRRSRRRMGFIRREKAFGRRKVFDPSSSTSVMKTSKLKIIK